MGMRRAVFLLIACDQRPFLLRPSALELRLGEFLAARLGWHLNDHGNYYAKPDQAEREPAPAIIFHPSRVLLRLTRPRPFETKPGLS